jgi:hypothetical protein
MSERHIELVACLHNASIGDALIYTRIANNFYRLKKSSNSSALEYVRLNDRSKCVDDARNITRYAPGYAYFDSINNAPLTQLQLERMILRLQAMGHLSDEQAQTE